MMTKLLVLALILAPSLAFADKNFEEGKGATWDCGEDPVVNIDHGSGTYTFVGTCTAININGGSNKITVSTVDDLNIFAGNNRVTVGVVGSVNIIGSGNRVTWKRAKDGDAPTVTDVGTGNQVGQAAPK